MLWRFFVVITMLSGCSGSVSWTYHFPKANLYMTLQYPRKEAKCCYVIFSRDSTVNEASKDVDYLKILKTGDTNMAFIINPESDSIIVDHYVIYESNNTQSFSFKFLGLNDPAYQNYYADDLRLKEGYQEIRLYEYLVLYDNGDGKNTEVEHVWWQVVGKKKGRKHYCR